MKPCESAIITVKYGNRSVDMELPVFLPVKELIKSISETMKVMEPSSMLDTYCTGLQFQGKLLDIQSHLASNGVWDGSFIECVLEREGAI